MLGRAVVNTGETGATITLNTLESPPRVIAFIEADNPDDGRVYDLILPPGGFSIVVTGAPDVIVTYD